MTDNQKTSRWKRLLDKIRNGGKLPENSANDNNEPLATENNEPTAKDSHKIYEENGRYHLNVGELDLMDEKFQDVVLANDIHDYETDPDKLALLNSALQESNSEQLNPIGVTISMDKFNLVDGPGGGFANPAYHLEGGSYAAVAYAVTAIQSRNILTQREFNNLDSIDSLFMKKQTDPAKFDTLDSMMLEFTEQQGGVMMPLSEWEPEWPKKLAEEMNTNWDDYKLIMPDDTKYKMMMEYINIETGECDYEHYQTGDIDRTRESVNSMDIKHDSATLIKARNDAYAEMGIDKAFAKQHPTEAMKKITQYVCDTVKYDDEAIFDRKIYEGSAVTGAETVRLYGSEIDKMTSGYQTFISDHPEYSASDFSLKYYQETGTPILSGESYLDENLLNELGYDADMQPNPESAKMVTQYAALNKAKTLDASMRMTAAALIDHHGECSGQTMATKFLANGLDIPNVYTIGIKYPNQKEGHAVIGWVDDKGENRIFDATVSQHVPDAMNITTAEYTREYLPEGSILKANDDALTIDDDVVLDLDGLTNNDLQM